MCQFDQPDAVLKLFDDTSGYFDCEPGFARASYPCQRQEPPTLQSLADVDELLLAPDKTREGDWQVVTDCRACVLALRAAAPPHGFNTGTQLFRLMRLERKRGQQPLGRVAVRMRCSAFKLLDAVDAQTGALGESFLRQACRDAVLPQQSAKLPCSNRQARRHPPRIRLQLRDVQLRLALTRVGRDFW